MEDERKYRNYVIAGAVGGFLLPIAGLVGAMVFYSRDDRAAAAAGHDVAVDGTLVRIVRR